MKPLVELLQKGFICRYQPVDIPFYILLGEAPELQSNGQLQFGSLYFYEEPCDWLRSNDKVVTTQDKLECLSVDDRSKLVEKCTSFPVDLTDPIMIALLNELKFKEIIRSLYMIENGGESISLSYDALEKDVLFKQIVVAEQFMAGNNTVVLLCAQICFSIHTKPALEHIVDQYPNHRIGPAMDELVRIASEELKKM